MARSYQRRTPSGKTITVRAYNSRRASTRKARQKRMKQQAIKIKPENRGKLRAAAGAKKGQKIPASKLAQMKRSKNPKTRRRATFAMNARRWKRG